MSYYGRHRGVGDAVTASITPGGTAPTTTVSTGPAGAPASTISAAAIAAQWAAARKPALSPTVTMSQGTQAQVAAVSAQLPALTAAAQAACASYTDPVANAHCIEAAQVLSGPDLARNVQSKLDCDDLINQGALTDDQRLDCVDCSYNRGIPKAQLVAATIQLEVDRAYLAGVAQQTFFAKHKVAIFAAGGSVVALGVVALILRKKKPVQSNRRRLR